MVFKFKNVRLNKASWSVLDGFPWIVQFIFEYDNQLGSCKRFYEMPFYILCILLIE